MKTKSLTIFFFFFFIIIIFSFDTAESALQHSRKTHDLVIEMGKKHVTEVNSLVTRGFDSNEQHDAEISSLRATAEHDVLKNSENISTQFNGWW